MSNNDHEQAVNKETAGLLNAAKWGIWVWIAVTVLPLVMVVLCCVGCFGLGIVGSAGQ